MGSGLLHQVSSALALAVLLCIVADGVSAHPVYSQLRVSKADLTSEVVAQLLHANEKYDVEFRHDHATKEAIIIAEVSAITALKEILPQLKVEHHDLSTFYAQRGKRHFRETAHVLTDADPLTTGPQSGALDMTGILDFVTGLQQRFPDKLSKPYLIGCTLEGRPMWAVRMSNVPCTACDVLQEAFPNRQVGDDVNEFKSCTFLPPAQIPESTVPRLVFTGMHHSREPASMMSLLWMMRDWIDPDRESFRGGFTTFFDVSTIDYLMARREIWFVPVVNPDGYAWNIRNWPDGGGFQRKNQRKLDCAGYNNGVDLNRNYGHLWGYDNAGSSPHKCAEDYRGTAPFSEPETTYLSQFVAKLSPNYIMNLHTYGGELLYPYGYAKGAFPDTPEEVVFFQRAAFEMTRVNRYMFGTGWGVGGGTGLYVTNGESDDYYYGALHIKAMTAELGQTTDGFYPHPARYPAICSNGLRMFNHLALISGAWLNITSLTLTYRDDQWMVSAVIRNEGLELLPTTDNMKLIMDAHSRSRTDNGGVRNMRWHKEVTPPYLGIPKYTEIPVDLPMPDDFTLCKLTADGLYNWDMALFSLDIDGMVMATRAFGLYSSIRDTPVHGEGPLCGPDPYNTASPSPDASPNESPGASPNASPNAGESPSANVNESPSPYVYGSPGVSGGASPSPRVGSPTSAPSPTAAPGITPVVRSPPPNIINASPGYSLDNGAEGRHSDSSTNSSGLTTPQGVGVAFGVVAILGVLFGISYFVVRRVRARRINRFRVLDAVAVVPSHSQNVSEGPSRELPSLRPRDAGDPIPDMDSDDVLTGEESDV